MSCACSLSQLLRSTRDIHADALALRVALDGEPSNVMAWIVREKAAFTEGGRDAAESTSGSTPLIRAPNRNEVTRGELTLHAVRPHLYRRAVSQAAASPDFGFAGADR